MSAPRRARAFLALLAPLALLSPLASGGDTHFYGGPLHVDPFQTSLKAGFSSCTAEAEHHGNTIRVHDLVLNTLGSSTWFMVTADTHDATGVSPCGDHEFDQSVECNEVCTVPFGPGLDGYYHVFVSGSIGTVSA